MTIDARTVKRSVFDFFRKSRAGASLPPHDLPDFQPGQQGLVTGCPTQPSSVRPPGSLRIMTYNVHSCIGTDGRISPFRIAGIIAEYGPDVVALQELDAGRARTGHIHQAEEIAGHLNMDFHFHPSFEIRDEKFGNAILSRYPSRLIQAGSLPSFQRWKAPEKRGAVWAAIQYNGTEVQIINTHLGLHRRERLMQAECLLGGEWSSHASCRPPLIVCGDFNALPVSRVYRRFRDMFRDAQLSNGKRPLSTYPSWYPIARIDHVFTSFEVAIKNIHVPLTPLTRAASDHLPLIIDIGME